MDIEKIKIDPWGSAYLCSINKCSLDDASKVLNKLLNSSDQDFRTGIEYLKALKSYLEPGKFLYVFKNSLTEELIDKLVKISSSENILSSFNKDYNYALGLITILELYPFMDKYRELEDNLKKLISSGYKLINEDSLLDFYHALIYGPISTLPIEILDRIIEEFNKLPFKPELLIVKSDLLKMIIEAYPPKLLVEKKHVFDTISRLVIDISEKLLLMLEEDRESVSRILSDLNIFQQQLLHVCRETGDWSICRDFHIKTKEVLDRLYEEISMFFYGK
ncbi:MAG: hypothetical protein B6U89_01610 [Desulfurococcales archaeon ex4484_58]|nr:MAG: hypothetical protein B6U89_01610 [Desulfurococcales archaeon ex4484_58]